MMDVYWWFLSNLEELGKVLKGKGNLGSNNF